MSNEPRLFPDMTDFPDPWTENDVIEHLQVAMHVELSTIPLYLYAMCTIKEDTDSGEDAYGKIKRQSHLLRVPAFVEYAPKMS